MFNRSFTIIVSLLLSILLNSQLANAESAERIVFSKQYQLSSVGAYQLQQAFVTKALANNAAIYGFKGGLNSQKAQRRFGLTEPVSGVFLKPLLQASKKPNLLLSQSVKPMLELELAFTLKHGLNKPVTMAELKQAVKSFAPAIEVPDLGFQAVFNGLDIIANNAIAYEVLVGQFHSNVSAVDDVNAQLLCGDEKVSFGGSSKVMQSQWNALLWLVNHVIGLGYSIDESHVLLTGNMAQLVPAKACRYQAVFSVNDKPLEAMHFSFTDDR